MSHSAVVASAVEQAPVELEERQQTDDEDDVPLPPIASRQPTGDRAVDEVLGRLDVVTDEPLGTQIEVSEQVHRVLQGRLADLGKE